MPSFGPTELIIILVIVILLFGVGRVAKVGGEMGKAVSNFRRGINENQPPAASTTTTTTDADTPSRT